MKYLDLTAGLIGLIAALIVLLRGDYDMFLAIFGGGWAYVRLAYLEW
jgi:hypothetical protein